MTIVGNNQHVDAELHHDVTSKNATLLKNIQKFFLNKTSQTTTKISYKEMFKLEYGLKETLIDPHGAKISKSVASESSTSTRINSRSQRKKASTRVVSKRHKASIEDDREQQSHRVVDNNINSKFNVNEYLLSRIDKEEELIKKTLLDLQNSEIENTKLVALITTPRNDKHDSNETVKTSLDSENLNSNTTLISSELKTDSESQLDKIPEIIETRTKMNQNSNESSNISLLSEGSPSQSKSSSKRDTSSYSTSSSISRRKNADVEEIIHFSSRNFYDPLSSETATTTMTSTITLLPPIMLHKSSKLSTFKTTSQKNPVQLHNIDDDLNNNKIFNIATVNSSSYTTNLETKNEITVNNNNQHNNADNILKIPVMPSTPPKSFQMNRPAKISRHLKPADMNFEDQQNDSENENPHDIYATQ